MTAGLSAGAPQRSTPSCHWWEGAPEDRQDSPAEPASRATFPSETMWELMDSWDSVNLHRTQSNQETKVALARLSHS